MTANVIARTGRVQSWLDNPESRLPVSCTIFNVDDSIEGREGIESSWRYVSYALRHGAGVAVHLSKLRANGTENEKGLVASGPVSFARIYSALNETLRRGGVYKNGAVVIHLDADHPDIVEFITTPRAQLPWVKRCVDISPALWRKLNRNAKEALIYGIRSGDIWLNKIKYDRQNKRIYGNVCLEVYLPSRGTCLLQHINLSACQVGDLKKAFANGMSELCDLHGRTGVGESGEYLTPDNDRQVGLGVLGLANFLRRYNITYEKFGEALRLVNLGHSASNEAGIAAWALNNAIFEAAQIARENNMVRAFAIAPTASCSYRSRDLDGFTCTPEIAPPIAKMVDRDSGEFGVERVNYGNVEIASEVGWDAYKRVADEIMTMLDRTGLLHGYSFNSWSDMIRYDEAFIEEWLHSPQTSLYYSLQVMGDVQDKSDAYAALGDTDIQDYLDGILDNKIECDCQQ